MSIVWINPRCSFMSELRLCKVYNVGQSCEEVCFSQSCTLYEFIEYGGVVSSLKG
jgi:hypothetical protein